MHGMTSVVVGRERVRGESRLHGCVLQTRAVAGCSRQYNFDLDIDMTGKQEQLQIGCH